MSQQQPDEMHERFGEWLALGAHGDPPRDAAVHAFVCPACQRQMAAFDALTTIDPSRATLPASRPVAATRGARLPVWRGAAAAVVIVMAAGVSFGAFRMLASPVASDPSQTPVQAVLGGEGRPGPRVGVIGGEANGLVPSPTPLPTTSDRASPSAQANGPATTVRPNGSQSPAATTRASHTAAATPTQRPTPRASASASASAPASATPTPSSTLIPTPTATAVATPIPTITPPPSTPEPTPTPTPPASVSVSSE
jgi:hypothetical protein